MDGKAPPRRVTNAARRPREYLTAEEVERLMAAARSRGGRHGLRASELTGLRWDMLDLAQGHLHVHRLKNGRPSVHTLRGSELRALRRLQREQDPPSLYLCTTERRTPMNAAGFRKQLAVIGVSSRAPLPYPPAHAAPRVRFRARRNETRHGRSALEELAAGFLERAVGMQVMVEGAAGDAAELAADAGDAACPVGHEVLGVAQPVDGHDPRPTAVAAPGTGRQDAFLDPLADEVALHLGERGLDLQEGPAGGGGGVHGRVERLEADAALFEAVDQGEQVARQPAEAIEVEDDQNVVAAQMIEAGGQAGACRRLGAGAVSWKMRSQPAA